MPAPRSFKTTLEAINLQLSRPCHQQELQAVALLSSYFPGSRSPLKKTKKQCAAVHHPGGGENNVFFDRSLRSRK